MPRSPTPAVPHFAQTLKGRGFPGAWHCCSVGRYSLQWLRLASRHAAPERGPRGPAGGWGSGGEHWVTHVAASAACGSLRCACPRTHADQSTQPYHGSRNGSIDSTRKMGTISSCRRGSRRRYPAPRAKGDREYESEAGRGGRFPPLFWGRSTRNPPLTTDDGEERIPKVPLEFLSLP